MYIYINAYGINIIRFINNVTKYGKIIIEYKLLITKCGN